MYSRIKASFLTSLVTFLGFVDTNILIPVIALYAASMGAGTGTIGLVVGLYSLTNFLTNIIGGRLVDRVGFKHPLIGGLSGDAIAMLLYSLCHTPVQLALVRAFHGFSGGLAGPATMAAAGRTSDKKSKGKAMSYYGIAIACAT
jgi:MFS family permease